MLRPSTLELVPGAADAATGAGAPAAASTATALTHLRRHLQEGIDALAEALARTEALCGQLDGDAGPDDAPALEQVPVLSCRVGEAVTRLSEADSRWRRAEVRALHERGLSTRAIAKLLGVSHQRISVLLKDTAASA
ncbi:hypothetical protein CLV92_109160 [Kineococcus xinjiangensis]|uniref:Homeodomain-like domain-containing protein n=1 Tax=Kineococcus xinjiangensis TaxID=512762 RepID=A0A2S6II31_9ACTN|nr:hypothetical protein CLV92_109160 [Kineococcus xinjiangensis]